MDRQLWHIVTRAIVRVNRQLPRDGRRPRYSDVLIVRMFLWSAWHERPMVWACDRQHYTGLFRPRRLPSVSQFCRRLKAPRVLRMIDAVNDRLIQRDRPATVSFFDGKPLPISNHSRDTDAKKGYADGTFRRGYKLHAWATEDGRIGRFAVRAMNVGEPNTARELTDRIPAGCLVLADANYDSAKLYKAVDACGAQLLTPLKGRAQSAVRRRYMPNARRRAMDLWQRHPADCKRTLATRYQIERIFGALTCVGGGLNPLPAWVRRLPRVQRWVTAKIILYHARLLCREVA
jgi:hypothetical protein